jgi:hypothetical protein
MQIMSELNRCETGREKSSTKKEEKGRQRK